MTSQTAPFMSGNAFSLPIRNTRTKSKSLDFEGMPLGKELWDAMRNDAKARGTYKTADQFAAEQGINWEKQREFFRNYVPPKELAEIPDEEIDAFLESLQEDKKMQITLQIEKERKEKK